MKDLIFTLRKNEINKERKKKERKIQSHVHSKKERKKERKNTSNIHLKRRKKKDSNIYFKKKEIKIKAL